MDETWVSDMVVRRHSTARHGSLDMAAAGVAVVVVVAVVGGSHVIRVSQQIEKERSHPKQKQSGRHDSRCEVR
jgi:hypothetical protein